MTVAKKAALKKATRAKSARSKTAPAPNDTPVLLTINGVDRPLTAKELIDPAVFEVIEEQIRAASGGVIAHIRPAFVDLVPEATLRTLNLLQSIQGLKFQNAAGQLVPNLLAAVGHVLKYDASDLNRCQSGRRLIVEMLAISYWREMKVAVQTAKKLLRDAGYQDVKPNELMREARELRERLLRAGQDAASGRPVKSVLPGAPVSNDALIPEGWDLKEDSLTGTSEVPIFAPVVVTERGRDDRQNRETLTLAWLEAGAWRQMVCHRGDVADARTIVSLADRGFPVTSVNAREMVAYIAAYEAKNRPCLMTVRVVSRMGYLDDFSGFLWGRSFLAASTEEFSEELTPTAVFRGQDAGDDQIVEGYHASGTEKEWSAAVALISDCPVVMFCFYASFVPALAPFIGAPNSVISLAGATSTGKTTAISVAASIWGNPNNRGSRTLVHNWDSTAVFRDRLAAITGNLPLFLDETQLARDWDQVTKTVYSITQGRGRGRGTVDGIAAQSTIDVTLFLTGEKPIWCASPDGGVVARTMEFVAPPFAPAKEAAGSRVAAVNRGIRENFGHAGPQFVRYVLDHRLTEATAWRDEYRRLVDEFSRGGSANAVANRMAESLAAVAVAAKIVHNVLQLPWPFSDPVGPLHETLQKTLVAADKGAAALQIAANLYASNRASFWDPKERFSKQPICGWYGRTGTSPNSTKMWVGFDNNRLDQLLRQSGYSLAAMLPIWEERRWLVTETNSKKTTRLKKAVDLNGRTARMVVISEDALKFACQI